MKPQCPACIEHVKSVICAHANGSFSPPTGMTAKQIRVFLDSLPLPLDEPQPDCPYCAARKSRKLVAYTAGSC